MELLTRKKTASIDLLKDEQKVKSSSQKKLTVIICVLVLLLIGLISAGLFSYNLSQKIQLNKRKNEIKTKIAAWQVLEPVGSNLKIIAEKDKVLSQTETKYAALDKKIDKIRELLPQGISFTNLTINNQGKVVITAKASEVDIIYQFYNLLKNEKDVTQPTLDSLTKSTSEYSFSISLILTTK